MKMTGYGERLRTGEVYLYVREDERLDLYLNLIKVDNRKVIKAKCVLNNRDVVVGVIYTLD